MLRPREDHVGRRFNFTCAVRGHEAEGRKALIKQGPITTRVAPIGEDGAVIGQSYCVPTRDVQDIQPEVRNQKRRLMAHHADRYFPRTALIRGLESEGRHFLVQAGSVESRLICIGQDGKSTGRSFVLPSELVYDVKDATELPVETTTMSDRGEVVLPANMRAARAIIGKWSVEITATTDGWHIRPLAPIQG